MVSVDRVVILVDDERVASKLFVRVCGVCDRLDACV